MADLKNIKRFLASKGLKYEVIDLGDDVFTVDGVREAGVEEGDIVKTLIIRSNERLPAQSQTQRVSRLGERASGSEGFKALAVRGKDRLDFKKVRKLFGSKSELAKAKEVEKVAKVPVGAVCPILLDCPLIFDKKVMGLKHVNMGSGDLKYGLEMDFEDLLKAIGKYKVEDLIID